MRLSWFAMLAASASATIAAAGDPVSAGIQPRRCLMSDIVGISPGDRLQLMDDFRTDLPARERRRLDTALPRDSGEGVAQCDGIDRSRASCEAAAYLRALRKTGLTSRFLVTACSRGIGNRASPVDRPVPNITPHHTR